MSGTHLESNLKRIASQDEKLAEVLRGAYDPDYPEIRSSKNGCPIPVVARKCLHSTYNPEVEAKKWVQSLDIKPDADVSYVLGGLGFGYHLSELLRVIPSKRLTVIERDTKLAAAALAHRSGDVFPQGLRFIVGEDPVQAYQKLPQEDRSNRKKMIFLEHLASSHAYPDYYTALKGIIQVQDVSNLGGYKILLVSPLYGGSLPVTHYVHRALISLGHRCELLDNSIFYPGFQHFTDVTSNQNHQANLKAGLTALLAESITARALEIHADLVLCMAQSPVIPEVTHELNNADIKTAFWFVEDAQTLNYWQGIAPHIQNFFVIQRGDFYDQLREIGCDNPYYLPLAADPSVHRPLQLSRSKLQEFGSDLSHVGAGYHNRRQFFAGLLDLDFKIWGSEWDNAGILNRAIQREGERVSTEDTVKIFNATRININLHSSTYHSGVNPFGDFINPRTFEIACCGAFQVVDEREYLLEIFQRDSEITTFSSLQELRDKALYYLEKPQERKQIAAAARERVLSQHTYEHRMLELLGVIAGRNPGWSPHSGGLPTAEEIIRQEGNPESDLAKVMQRFTDRGPLTLEDIAVDIEKDEGELSRTEAMILLLNEFRRWGLEKGVL